MCHVAYLNYKWSVHCVFFLASISSIMRLTTWSTKITSLAQLGWLIRKSSSELPMRNINLTAVRLAFSQLRWCSRRICRICALWPQSSWKRSCGEWAVSLIRMCLDFRCFCHLCNLSLDRLFNSWLIFESLFRARSFSCWDGLISGIPMFNVVIHLNY